MQSYPDIDLAPPFLSLSLSTILGVLSVFITSLLITLTQSISLYFKVLYIYDLASDQLAKPFDSCLVAADKPAETDLL